MKAETWNRLFAAGIIPAWKIRESLGLPIPSDPNPLPRFRLFRWLP